MAKPRKALISLGATAFYHCISRCVKGVRALNLQTRSDPKNLKKGFDRFPAELLDGKASLHRAVDALGVDTGHTEDAGLAGAGGEGRAEMALDVAVQVDGALVAGGFAAGAPA